MKLSQKQAELLAAEVVKQLKEKRTFVIDPKQKQDLKQWVEKREALDKKVMDAQEVARQHDKLLYNICGKNNSVCNYDPLDKMISKIEQKNIPSISQITDEIILQGMFADEKDMNSFLQKIISKWDKKKQRKTQLN